jgi:mRNA-degrading endonuclease toxin of MazEF toxin-antitoxin module
VQVDWIFTFFRANVGRVIGRLDDVTMREVDLALRRWFDL